jgi:tRNA G10  N-methylase Trm11
LLYYASFIPGLQELIAEIVRERLPDVVIQKLLDGAVLFETDCNYDRLNFFCFNNIFAVISIMEHAASPEAHIRAVAQNGILPAAGTIFSHNSKQFRTFRIVISQENKPAAIDEKLRHTAEQYIAKLSGLTVNRSRPDTEFWFLYRGEGFSLFMKRLTLRPSWEKSLHPGELPPPLAWILCHLGNLKHSDTVLDPFCGYGSIPQAALKHFHITQFIACDTNTQAAAYTAARFKNRRDKFILYTADFRSLTAILPKQSVDVIITDPPWGNYRRNQAVQPGIAPDLPSALYEEMFRVFETLLKADGRIIILGARTDELPHAANAAQNHFTLLKHIPILLSGKKAAIFCFCRKGIKRAMIGDDIP